MTTLPGSRPTEPCVVLENREAAAEQRLLVVDGGAHAADYVLPGQVVEMEEEGARAFMVIASPLDERPHLSFLIRTGRHMLVAEGVTAMPAGGTVSMTRPFGPGFRLERAAGHRLVCCVAGTGIAAVRPVLCDLAARSGSLAGTTLYYGVRTRAHVAFRAELQAWARQGLAVRVCLSAEAPHDPWDRAGRVPTVLTEEETDLSDAAIVLAGPREMGPALEEIATAKGMPAERCLKNF